MIKDHSLPHHPSTGLRRRLSTKLIQLAPKSLHEKIMKESLGGSHDRSEHLPGAEPQSGRGKSYLDRDSISRPRFESSSVRLLLVDEPPIKGQDAQPPLRKSSLRPHKRFSILPRVPQNIFGAEAAALDEVWGSFSDTREQALCHLGVETDISTRVDSRNTLATSSLMNELEKAMDSDPFIDGIDTRVPKHCQSDSTLNRTAHERRLQLVPERRLPSVPSGLSTRRNDGYATGTGTPLAAQNEPIPLETASEPCSNGTELSISTEESVIREQGERLERRLQSSEVLPTQLTTRLEKLEADMAEEKARVDNLASELRMQRIEQGVADMSTQQQILEYKQAIARLNEVRRLEVSELEKQLQSFKASTFNRSAPPPAFMTKEMLARSPDVFMVSSSESQAPSSNFTRYKGMNLGFPIGATL